MWRERAFVPLHMMRHDHFPTDCQPHADAPAPFAAFSSSPGLRAAHAQEASQGEWRHATALTGDPKYPEGFRAFRLRQSGRAEGRRGAARHRRAASTASTRSSHARQPAPRASGYLYDTLMTSVLRRAEHQRAIRPDRRSGVVPGRLFERHVPAAAGGALARRRADHGRGRGLELREDRRAQPQLSASTTATSTRPR